MQNLNLFTFMNDHGRLLSTERYENGNMLRTTQELLLLADGRIPFDEEQEYEKGIDQCLVPGSVGLYSRYRNSLENTSVDDYLTLGTDPVHAAMILHEARTHYGFLDVNRKFTFSQFIPRFLGLWQHLRISAGEEVGTLGQLIWAVSLVMSACQPISNQDNWLLSHMMVKTKEDRGFTSLITDLAVAFWRMRKSKTSAEIFADYCGTPDHPLVEAWKPYK
jgi:hypothetical protein